jgi:hypothetical protein
LAGGENRLLSLARVMEAHGLGGGGMYGGYGGAYPRNQLMMAGLSSPGRPQYIDPMNGGRVGPIPPFVQDFRDDIFRKPSAPGTETLDFDPIDVRNQERVRDWLEERQRAFETVPRFR